MSWYMKVTSPGTALWDLLKVATKMSARARLLSGGSTKEGCTPMPIPLLGIISLLEAVGSFILQSQQGEQGPRMYLLARWSFILSCNHGSDIPSTMLYNIIISVVSHHFSHILSVTSKSQVTYLLFEELEVPPSRGGDYIRARTPGVRDHGSHLGVCLP